MLKTLGTFVRLNRSCRITMEENLGDLEELGAAEELFRISWSYTTLLFELSNLSQCSKHVKLHLVLDISF